MRALVMKGSLPPVFDDEFRNENCDLMFRMLALDLQNVIDLDWLWAEKATCRSLRMPDGIDRAANSTLRWTKSAPGLEPTMI